MSESIVQKQAGLQGLNTAILLPSVSLFGEAAGLYPNEVGPLTSVVGIGLFQRTVLTLQRAGIRQLMVLVGPEEDQLKQALGKGSRVTIPSDSPDSASTSSLGSPMSANVAPNPASSVMRSTGEFMSRMIVPMLTLHASRSISSVARRRITVCRICQARLRSFNVPLPV